MSLFSFYSSLDPEYEPKQDIQGQSPESVKVTASADSEPDFEAMEAEAIHQQELAIALERGESLELATYETPVYVPAVEDIAFRGMSYDELYNHSSEVIFTVTNPLGLSYTFRVTKADHRDAFFVSLYTPESRRKRRYRYLFMVIEDRSIIFTKKSSVTIDDLETQIYTWAVKVLKGLKPLPDGYTIKKT